MDGQRTTIPLMATNFLRVVEGAGYTVLLLGRTAYWCRSAVFKIREIAQQCYVTGIESMFVTLAFALFSGMVLALQTGLEMKRYGLADPLGFIVAASMVREMGPMMTAIILTGRTGSAMAAELGTMAVSEEIEALEVMSINPVRFLVMPRVVALMVMTPVLTVFANTLGILGGGVVANAQIGVDLRIYFDWAQTALDWNFKDAIFGLFKAGIFGVTIAIIACSQGLRATNGAAGVGKGTRDAVVIGLMMIVILNYMLSSLFKIALEIGIL